MIKKKMLSIFAFIIKKIKNAYMKFKLLLFGLRLKKQIENKEEKEELDLVPPEEKTRAFLFIKPGDVILLKIPTFYDAKVRKISEISYK